MRFELEKLQALDRLRNEHSLELKSECQQHMKEQHRADGWISDLKAHFRAEKDRFLDRIHVLEEELGRRPERTGTTDSVPQTSTTATVNAPGSATVPSTGISTPTSSSPTTSVATSSGTSTDATSPKTVVSTPSTSGGTVVSTATTPVVSTASSGIVVPPHYNF